MANAESKQRAEGAAHTSSGAPGRPGSPSPRLAAEEVRVRLAAGVPDLAALGASEPGDLLAPERLATGARAEDVPRLARDFPGERLVRVPLPGTPDADGRQHERPRGAGTGWLWIRLFDTGFVGGLRARFGRPPSASLAERRWNLACLLGEAGVGTPELVAVAAAGAGPFSRRSALVVREPARMVPVDAWMRTEVADEPRLLGLEAVGRALARLERSGVVLPRLLPEGLRVLHREGEACGATPPLPNVDGDGAGLTMHRLPGVVVTDLREGFAAKPASPASPASQKARESVAWCASELENLLRTEAEREALALGLSHRPG